MSKSKFEQLTEKELALYKAKNKDYTFGGSEYGNFERVSAIKKLYPDMDWATPVGVCLGYLLKQFDSAFWMLSNGYEGEVEGIDERLADVGVYTKIARILHKERKC